MPKFSIIIPNYNQEKLIIKALDSIPKRKDIQILIIDDCSTDNSWNVINEWCNDNSKFFYNIIKQRNDVNKGCGYGKNLMYTLAEGDYIITLDSDDYLYTNKYSAILDKIYTLNDDIIFIGNDINNGGSWTSSDRKATWSYFVRSKFLRDSNLNYEKTARRAGDYKLTKALRQLPHSEIVLKDVIYHYNYPREGSIVWNYEHGE